MVVKYKLPNKWIGYNREALTPALVEARAAVLSLKTIPFQKDWVDSLQKVQLRFEVAGTSRIEGADFTESELDAALEKSPNELITRSQKQAAAAKRAYQWIATVDNKRPIDADVIREIHSLIVKDADEDHCAPGQLRETGQNVIFGAPQHRGAEGGTETRQAFDRFIRAIERDFQDSQDSHDPLIQALSAHYHFAALHPFLDGNGRTARALEALMLQRAGLRSICFIAMSNYYSEQKREYLSSLNEAGDSDHDLTSFLNFGLRGVTLQCQRSLDEVQKHLLKSLFRNLMYDLFTRLKTPRKRVIVDRQLEILKLLLDQESITLTDLIKTTTGLYANLSKPIPALIQDINYLIRIKAVEAEKLATPQPEYNIKVRLQWPTEITESDFFRAVSQLPHSRTYSLLSTSPPHFDLI